MNRWLILLLLAPGLILGQVLLKESSFRLDVPEPLKGLGGNGITDIVVAKNGTIWLGTGGGLSKSTDQGQTWVTFTNDHGLGKGGVSALYVSNSGDTIWVATAFDTLTSVSGRLDAGGGLSLSTDAGQTWSYQRQPGITNVQNVTFDMAVLDTSIWIVSWGGGVRRSNDFGQTWTTVAPDSNIYDVLLNLNHRGFSTVAVDDTLWVGTAGGINKSTDNGKTWRNFRHQNQQFPVSGNFVVALANQQLDQRTILWAATWVAEDTSEFYAISKTEDGGQTWSTFLKDNKAHNFGFDGHIVYVAADSGLFKSEDNGKSWYLFPPIQDTRSGEKVYSTDIYSVGVDLAGVLWVGTSDGLASTSSNGFEWQLTRAFKPTGQAGEKRTYAYPNPFSPMRHNQLQDEGHVRFQYNTKGPARVTIKVYDFAMDLVKDLGSRFRPAAGDYAEAWNGRNENGVDVANGVYFYKVEIDNDGTYWGKVMVVD